MIERMDPQALAAWIERLEDVRHLTPTPEAWARGYAQAVEATALDFDTFFAREEAKVELEPEHFPGDHERQALERKRRAQVQWKKERERKEVEQDFQGLREALDEAPDSLHMPRPMAQFYLHMSPKAFTQALKRGPHPFAEPRGGATKGDIDAWFQRTVLAKHKAVGSTVVRRARDFVSGRYYVVTEEGLLLTDADVSLLRGVALAKAIGQGADVQRMSLTQALAMPWADPDARKPWADLRQRVLERELERSEAEAERLRLALAKAREQDLDANLSPPSVPRGTRGGMRF